MTLQLFNQANLDPIYHLTPADYYHRQPKHQSYTPATFFQEGFVHCTSGETMLLEVANRYFADFQESLLALQIDPAKLTAPLKFEPPIRPSQAPPLPNYSTQEACPILFPHIYGPIERAAIKHRLTLSRDVKTGLWTL
jgi:uncharacterized protein (DUF952 family)